MLVVTPCLVAGSSIPVGIVSARQRLEADKSPRAELGPAPALPLPPSGPLVTPSSLGMGPSTWSSGPPPPWPAQHPAQPYPPSPWGPAPAPPPGCGPIPMGYQLAKDPMTGQILLIPTDPSARPPGPLWPGYECPPPPPHHQHLQYLQQQHSQDLLQHLHHRHGLPPAPAPAPGHKQPPRVPETITVSDDEEEAADTAAPATVKREAAPVKTEVKVEVGESEADSVYRLPAPVKPDLGELGLAIKQERGLSTSADTDPPLRPPSPAPACPAPPPATALGPESVCKREVKLEAEPNSAAQLAAAQESQLCAETLLLMSELPAAPDTADTAQQHHGFDILCEGLELLTRGTRDQDAAATLTALDLLCSVTRNDTFEYGLPQQLLADCRLDLGLLCAITAEEYTEHRDRVDPLLKLKSEYNVFQYCNEKLEKEAKNYISQKIKQFTKDHPETLEEEKYDNIKSLAKMVKKIKNMEIMSQLEVDLRLKITELQNKYRDSQKSLSKLKTPKKKNLKAKKGKQRGPGRPKKKKFPNPKSKMGRPRKHPKLEPKAEVSAPAPAPAPAAVPLEEELQAKVKLEEDESFADSDAPPVLEPQQELCVRRQEAEAEEAELGSFRGHGLLKPPRLTASSPPPGSREAGAEGGQDQRSTTLSTLTHRFMKGKANPFANLLSKLNSGQAGPAEAAAAAASSCQGPDLGSPASAELAERLSSSEKSSDESSSETGSMMSPTRDSSFKFGKTSKLGYGLEAYRHMKKRKADKPKKHSGGSSETIVPKKPKNLFMMMDFQRGFSAKTAEDEYNFDEHEEEFGQKPAGFEYRDPRKVSPSPSARSRDSSHYHEWTDEDHHHQPAPVRP